MEKIIAFRLNKKRARLIRQAQKQFKESNVSRLIEKAWNAYWGDGLPSKNRKGKRKREATAGKR